MRRDPRMGWILSTRMRHNGRAFVCGGDAGLSHVGMMQSSAPMRAEANHRFLKPGALRRMIRSLFLSESRSMPYRAMLTRKAGDRWEG